jgi:uncharacterized protein YcgI (DUF1989 family)
LRVVQQLEFERVVDANGQQVGDLRRHDAQDTLTFILAADPSGRWRIADSTRNDDAVVQL